LNIEPLSAINGYVLDTLYLYSHRKKRNKMNQSYKIVIQSLAEVISQVIVTHGMRGFIWNVRELSN